MLSNHSSEFPLLTLAAIDNWPFLGIQANDDGEVVSATGIEFDILNTLADVLQFRYHICILLSHLKKESIPILRTLYISYIFL